MNAEPHMLDGGITPTADLSLAERVQMRTLMEACFTGLGNGRFERDLEEKPWTILLRDAAGDIQGFSTLDLMEARVAGRVVKAVYSGDTVIAHRYRATSSLPRAFLRFVARHTGSERDDARWFWFYVCKGFRTYRFLPVFYHHFYPHPGLATPDFEQQVMDHLAMTRFGSAYDPSAGIVRVANDYVLREGVGDVTDARARDPFIRFFAERNPGWAQGEELVCLVALERLNLKSKPRKWLDREWLE